MNKDKFGGDDGGEEKKGNEEDEALPVLADLYSPEPVVVLAESTEPLRKLTLADKVKDGNIQTDHECIICFQLLDTETAKECQECGIGLCGLCTLSLKNGRYGKCP